MSNLTDIHKSSTWNTYFSGWCPTPVLPMAYDETISYMEQIIQLYTRVNQIISYLDSYEDQVLKQANDYTDSVVATNISSLRTELYSKITSETDTKLETLHNLLTQIINSNKEEADTRISALEQASNILQERLDDYYEYINHIQDNLNDKIDGNMDELRRYIDSLIVDVTNVYVHSPFTDEIITIQKALDEIVYNLSIGGLTALEFDTYAPTCYEYDRQGITALQFQTILRFLWFASIYLRMRNPFTGSYSEIDVIIYTLTEFHRNALTALEYDNLGLTAIGFTNKDITAYQFDFNGKAVLSA